MTTPMSDLANAIEDLNNRITDCDKLIADGKYTHEQAYEVMVKPQMKRIIAALRLLSVQGETATRIERASY